MASQSTSPAWLERPVFKDPAKLLTIENLLVALVLILAILSRFIMLDARTMSHDEVNHVVPSYDLYEGRGYRHDPVTHGPFQFHIVALSYFLFGDNDFSSRVPAATFSVLAVAFVLFAYRRYLGRSGALIAGFLFLISPYILFYGRYTRNEAFIELIGVVLLYGILRYLETGDRLSMFLVTIATVMHFIVKETSFIYTAEALIFLFVVFLVEVRRSEQRNPERYNRFLLLMGLAMVLLVLALGLALIKADKTGAATPTPTTAVGPNSPEQTAAAKITWKLFAEIGLVGGALALALLGLFLLARDIGWAQVRQFRSFSLIVLIGTLILPMLSPFPVSMMGGNPLDYTTVSGRLLTGGFIALFFIIGAVIGIWWNWSLWLQNAFVFYTIFVVFYTTFFTNADGFFTGVVGSLGYWLAQQGVERGSQPRYYYALLQMPVYEFLGILGTFLATYYGLRYRRFITLPGYSPAFAPRFSAEPSLTVPQAAAGFTVAEGAAIGDSAARNWRETLLSHEGTAVTNTAADAAAAASAIQAEFRDVQVAAGAAGGPAAVYNLPEESATALEPVEWTNEDKERARVAFYSQAHPLPVLALLLYWSVISLVAYSVAGERMPWLTVHIAMPFALTAGWGLGYLVDTTDWKRITRTSGLLAVLLFPVLFASLASAVGSLLGTNPPFHGSTLEQLQATNRFVISVIAAAGSLAGIIYLLRDWEAKQVFRLATVVFFALMAVLTARAAYRASFINYDDATEYLVYAHGAPSPKEVMSQIDEISRRITGGKNLAVAYSSDALYPYWWYLRDYPNKRWFQSNPTRDLRDVPIVIAGEDVFDKIDAVLGDNYYKFESIRLWWPNQDYYNLTWDRIWGVISNPAMREAVFNIWLNRDYTEYAKLTNETKELSLENWSPAARMRVYIRKDIANQIWNYGAAPSATTQRQLDPYASKLTKLAPVQVIGSAGNQPGQFQAPRGIKVAPDGSIYVADSRNNRIQHLSANGDVIKVWGVFGDATKGSVPDGSFNEPWDVAVGKDGSVYVSDTWNHRIQKFTADGQFVKTWGAFGQGETPVAFWGPRGLAVDDAGRLYVMDTGNKRVVIFDADGNFITQFGSAGFDKGQFDEPVGLALDAKGNVYITDTWNQRVQVMAPDSARMNYTPLLSWDISGWAGQSLDNKPFIAVSPVNGNVFVTDPEKPRVLEFDSQGQFLRGWGEFSTGTDGFGLASGVTVAPDGSVWVSDGANNVLLRFEVPEK